MKDRTALICVGGLQLDCSEPQRGLPTQSAEAACPWGPAVFALLRLTLKGTYVSLSATLTPLPQETLKSVIAQYNASQLITMREVRREGTRLRAGRLAGGPGTGTGPCLPYPNLG